jgi:DNA-binding transcriptional ArsR family regulator
MSAVDTEARAAVFAALGDPMRLQLLARLRGPGRHSIAALTSGTDLTRQAVTKHLRVLQGAGVLRAERSGREQHFTLLPQALQESEAFLHAATHPWDDRLAGLKDPSEVTP